MTTSPKHPGLPRPLTIAGLGLVTPLGASAWATFHALLAGRTLGDFTRKLASVSPPPDMVSLVQATGCVSCVQHVAQDPAIDLAERAAREALMDAGIPESAWPGVPMFLGVSKGTMHALGALAQQHHAQPRTHLGLPTTPADPMVLALGPVGYLAHHLRLRLGVRDIRPVVAACASSLTALHQARLALQAEHNPHPYALVLTSEAAIIPAFIHSYRRLGVLPPTTPESPDHYGAKPLDAQRRGFILAEQAAAVVLRCAPCQPAPSGPDISTPDNSPSLGLLHTAIASEAYDLMQPSPRMEGLRRVIRDLLEVQPTWDVLHPHATGTPDNDELEMRTYAEELSAPGATSLADIPAYAVKGAIGHGLGSSGLASLVLACLSARARRLPGMPWLRQPIACGFALHPQAATLPASTTHAVFAAGFGGHVAGAIIART